MKKISIRVLSLLLLLTLLISSTLALPVFASSEPTQYSTTSNSGTRNVVCTTLNGTSAADYYSGNNDYDIISTKSKDQIFSALQSLMRSTHSYTSSYNDCHYKADKTDCENGNGKVSLIYTSYSATMSQWNGWNREHVWPKSLGGDNTSGGGADMHHIRPSDATVNSTRGNKLYGYANGGKAVYGNNPASGCLGGHYGTYYEPLDNVKGDVARICLYVYVRWNSSWGADSITEVFQSVDVLLEWCELDPVDTWEMGRNEVIGSIQGNRNVFIDYPEYAWLIFGRSVPNTMTTPSGEAKNYDGSQSTTPPASHTHSYVNGECSCGATEPGYVPPASGEQGGSTTTPQGGNQSGTATAPQGGNQSGTATAPSSGEQNTGTTSGDCNHVFGDWEFMDATTSAAFRSCSMCGMVEFLTPQKAETSEPDGCESAINVSGVFIAFVPILGTVLMVKKKRKEI